MVTLIVNENRSVISVKGVVKMSDQFYIGYIDGLYVTKVFDISGSSAYALRDLLKYSNISIYDNFNYFATDDRFNPLFYYMDDESRIYASHNFGDIEDIQKVIKFNGGYWGEDTIHCNGEIIDDISLHLHEEHLKKVDYTSFHRLQLNKENIHLYLHEKDMNRGFGFIDDLILMYNEIVKFINENKVVFWQKYY